MCKISSLLFKKYQITPFLDVQCQFVYSVKSSVTCFCVFVNCVFCCLDLNTLEQTLDRL